MDALTKSWIRNKSDELAAANGCWFDVSAGAYAVWWIERYCRLYEGDAWAGQPVLMRGLPSMFPDLPHDWHAWQDAEVRAFCGIPEVWDEAHAVERAELHCTGLTAGEPSDWQYECTMRLFGWMRNSERWNRPIRRFTAASIWVAKKQKKTPTLAAWSLYLTCGDGESGAKVFAGAKDGTQARLQMDHAIAMVEQSPELNKECKINKNEASIAHLPTRSKYKPLSSADSRSKESKEGLNGSLAIDETHVVDREFIARTRRMGISRSEPLHLEVSTVGNNPESYGKERQDYARNVAAGSEKNDGLFVAIYEAPQDTKDTEIDADPVRFGQLANPAWGHTAHADEFLADYEESKRTISGLADFKMYRLNIWQQTAERWLKQSDWLACGREWTFDERPCDEAAAGLDLSKTRDMSALNLTFAVDDYYWQKTWLWITEAYANEHKSKARFREWAAAGYLVIVPGETINQGMIREQFDELANMINIHSLVYDKTYAQDFCAWVEDAHGECEPVEFPQSSSMMEKPIDDFQSLVLDGKLVHDENQCMNWQAGHCEVKPNFRGHRILCKPKPHDVRKIDGLVASVMGLWGAMNAPDVVAWSREQGALL